MDIIFYLITEVVPLLVQIFFIAVGIFLFILLLRLIRRFSVDRLRYERYFSDTCVYEGDSTELVETVWNPTLFFVPFADIESYFYSGLSVDRNNSKREMCLFVSRYHLLPFEKRTRKIRIDCVKRGYYQLTSVSVHRCGEENYIKAPAEIYVYPRIEPLAENIPSAYGLGNSISRKKLIYDPFSVNGIREYRAGDSFHTINFKASARLSAGGNPRFMVNRYDYCSNLKYYIYQNFHIPKDGNVSFDNYEEIMENGLKIAASLVVKAISEGGLCAFGANCSTVDGRLKSEFPIRGGETQKNDILREMAKIRAKDGASFSSILSDNIVKGIRNSEIFLITSYLDEGIEEQISLLERLGNTVRVIMPEAEIQ
ncbi:MAG: DUF58 domain-containing protein [Clostridia bacterium]|nr:DUF58 domain-containing protein [Clostridia bacterium]